MNDTFDTINTSNSECDLETNFNIATKMSEEKYDYSTLISFLGSENIVEKQVAVLKLNEIKSQNDAEILVSNLVGQDGKIREAVAFKINELTQNYEYLSFFINEKKFDTLFQGIMDINGNVCRQVVSSELAKTKEFQTYLCEKLPESINEILVEIKKIDLQTRQYVISKRNFQLYWCLETLYNVIGVIDINNIKEILLKTGDFQDYTIREKTAKILTRIDNPELNELREKLKTDKNYYVRRLLK